MKRLFSRPTVLFMAWLALVASVATAQADSGIFFGNSHLFIRSAQQGFNDWHNSYPWSMAELNGDLYVGTGRVEVTSSIMTFTGGMMGGTLPPLHADTPPLLSDFLAFTPTGIVVTDAAKYEAWRQGSRAEIWRLRWGRWQRVYQARFVPSLLRAADGTYPFEAAEIMGFRAMTAFREKDGTRALYAALGGFSFAVSPPLILRSTDGKNWMPVATPPAMGRETRALGVHSGRIYVGVGGQSVAGPSVPAAVWSSDDPSNSASWAKVLDLATADPTNTNVLSFASFNGRVYAGTENGTGFQVWRSTVEDPIDSADWTRIVTGGAGASGNAWAGTMLPFKGHLYVGSMSVPGLTGSPTAFKGFDLIRIGIDDKWDLVVGDPRAGILPLSGQASGFGNPFHLYCWSMVPYRGRLYLGTFDAATFMRLAKESGAPMPLPPGMTQEQFDGILSKAGGGLYWSDDGVQWNEVMQNGFGDWYNYGLRNMIVHRGVLWVGLSNPFYGLEMWAGVAYQ